MADSTLKIGTGEAIKENRLGLKATDYQGGKSTLCAGCGHAAIAHDGTSVIDVISPCVTFNNHEGSTKGYTYSKEHQELLHQIGFVPEYEQIEIDYEPGTTREVTLHDGSRIVLK